MTIDNKLILSDGTTYEGTLRYDERGEPIVEMATCNTCQFTWNDALTTGVTPTPSGRCPNEYNHVYHVVLWLAGSNGKRVGHSHTVKDMYDDGRYVLTMCGLRRALWNRTFTDERTLAVPVIDNRVDCHSCRVAEKKHWH